MIAAEEEKTESDALSLEEEDKRLLELEAAGKVIEEMGEPIVFLQPLLKCPWIIFLAGLVILTTCSILTIELKWIKSSPYQATAFADNQEKSLLWYKALMWAESQLQ